MKDESSRGIVCASDGDGGGKGGDIGGITTARGGDAGYGEEDTGREDIFV